MMFDDTLENVVETDSVDSLRAGTWTLLGRLMMDVPDGDLLERLIAIGSEKAAPDALGEAWAQLSEAAGTAREATLKTEYQNVFIGVGGGEVTPYASWYLTGSLHDRPLVELRGDLEALGVAIREDCSEPEDHAGAICEIMAFAIMDEDVDYEWQKEVFLRHIDKWMGRLFEDLRKAPSADFYRAVGALGEAFLQLERRFFAMSA